MDGSHPNFEDGRDLPHIEQRCRFHADPASADHLVYAHNFASFRAHPVQYESAGCFRKFGQCYCVPLSPVAADDRVLFLLTGGQSASSQAITSFRNQRKLCPIFLGFGNLPAFARLRIVRLQTPTIEAAWYTSIISTSFPFCAQNALLSFQKNRVAHNGHHPVCLEQRARGL